MEKKFFGALADGTQIYSYTINNGNVFAEIITYGAAVRKFGFSDDTSLSYVGSFDTIEDYMLDDSYQGAIVGRIANRVENATFTIDGITYNLTKNDGENSLHGGGVGFNRKAWRVTDVSDTSITLNYLSPDGEEGYPANLDIFVTYSLFGNAILIEYKATPDKKTPIALTNHSFFNVDGFGGTVHDQKIQIFADSYSKVNAKRIPTGEHPLVDGTVLDLRAPRRIGDAIVGDFSGYDHNYVLSPTQFETFNGKRLGLAACVFGKAVKLSAFTDMKNMQFYSGNFLGNGRNFAGNIKQVRHAALCLETQTEPNAVNRGIGIYDKGEVYTHNTAYRIEKTEECSK